MHSLFIVSLPRSLSSQTYELCTKAIGLKEPRWTTHGEILNADRVIETEKKTLLLLFQNWKHVFYFSITYIHIIAMTDQAATSLKNKET